MATKALPDYYAILGVPPGAGPEEIRRAYRRAVKSAHPDAGGSEEEFRRIKDAYETLQDADKRHAYDGARASRSSLALSIVPARLSWNITSTVPLPRDTVAVTLEGVSVENVSEVDVTPPGGAFWTLSDNITYDTASNALEFLFSAQLPKDPVLRTYDETVTFVVDGQRAALSLHAECIPAPSSDASAAACSVHGRSSSRSNEGSRWTGVG